MFLNLKCSNLPPVIELCSIVNVDKLHCMSNGPDAAERFITTFDALTYTCLSPKDLGETKKYIKKVVGDLEGIHPGLATSF